METEVKTFLEKRRDELHEALYNGMSDYGSQPREKAGQLFTYKLGQYDLITELIHVARIHDKDFRYRKE